MTVNIEARLSFTTFFSVELMKEFVDGFYLCPKCGSIAQGWFVNQEEGKADMFGLMCRHRFSSSVYLPTIRSIHHKDNLTIYLGFDVRTKEDVLRQRLFQRSESFVTNFLCCLYSNASQAPTTLTQGHYLTSSDITTTAVTASNTLQAIGYIRENAAAGDISQGMAVGTGNPTPAPADGALMTPILNGAAALKLVYGGEAFTQPVAVLGVITYTDARLFTNNSGNTIGINEAGAFTGNPSNFSPHTTMLLHDVTPSTVNVLNGNSATGTYTIQVTT